MQYMATIPCLSTRVNGIVVAVLEPVLDRGTLGFFIRKYTAANTIFDVPWIDFERYHATVHSPGRKKQSVSIIFNIIPIFTRESVWPMVYNASEIYAIGIEIEKNGRAFYHACAQTTGNPQVKKLWRRTCRVGRPACGFV